MKSLALREGAAWPQLMGGGCVRYGLTGGSLPVTQGFVENTYAPEIRSGRCSYGSTSIPCRRRVRWRRRCPRWRPLRENALPARPIGRHLGESSHLKP